jgi:hypothetical protein
MDVLPDDIVAPAGNTEAAFAERLDESAYRDDILRLLFTCIGRSRLPIHRQKPLTFDCTWTACLKTAEWREGYEGAPQCRVTGPKIQREPRPMRVRFGHRRQDVD